MATKSKLSKTERVLRAIAKKALSAAQIRSQFGVSNVSAVIYDIFRRGYDVDKQIGKDGLVRYSL